MEKIAYKVAASGRISLHRGKKKCSPPWEEVPVMLSSRKVLRARLDPVIVRAAWTIFGRRCLPADLNELLRFKNLLRQVMADSPKLMAPIYFTVQHGDLSHTPAHSAVKRFKNLLMRVGYQKAGCEGSVMRGGLGKGGKKRWDSDVNRYWRSNDNEEALSEAGWRYLLRLPYPVLRNLADPYCALHPYIAALNLLGVFNALPLPQQALDTVTLMSTVSRGTEKDAHIFALAVRDAYAAGARITSEDVDAIRGWVRSGTFALNPGTSWQTIVERAFAYALAQAEKRRAEMAAYRWVPPIGPFVANDGLVVTPLSNGVELLEEGVTQQNCLRQMESYAQRAMLGESQVFSIKGGAGRVTVEFTRRRKGTWRREQAVEKYNKPISRPALLRAVDMLGHRLNGEGE